MSKVVKFPGSEPKVEGAKRIYVYPEFTHSVTESCPTDVGYVREDIVDELVEALEKVMEFNDAYWKLINFSPSNTGTIKELTDKAKAALAKLEESHD